MENAWTLVNNVERKPGFVISTGSASLDALLGGGIYTGEVTEVFGPFTTGKTQLAMSVALQAVILPSNLVPNLNSLGRVWYLDSSTNFSSIRLSQMFENRLSSKDSLADANQRLEGVFKVLERIQLFDVANAFQVLNILSQLEMLLYEAHCNIPDTIRSITPTGLMPEIDGLNLVVIDALGLLLAPIVSLKHKFGRVIMLEIAQLMRSIASNYNIAFLVINHTSTDWSQKDNAQTSNGAPGLEGNAPNGLQRNVNSNLKSTNPLQAALGKYWSYVPSVQLMLRYPTQDAQLAMGGRVAELRKSSHAPTGPTARSNFTITNKGVDEPLGGT